MDQGLEIIKCHPILVTIKIKRKKEEKSFMYRREKERIKDERAKNPKALFSKNKNSLKNYLF